MSDETLQKVKETLKISSEDHLGKVIALAWKFVTLPNPLIVDQPKAFDYQIHDPEFGHWDKQAKDFELIYTRPVVYRNYEGVLAEMGWVANTTTDNTRSTTTSQQNDLQTTVTSEQNDLRSSATRQQNDLQTTVTGEQNDTTKQNDLRSSATDEHCYKCIVS